MLTRFRSAYKHSVKPIFYPKQILPGEGGVLHPNMFFLHHPETPQAFKLKLSDIKDISLRQILQLIQVCYILNCYHGNNFTKGTLQNLDP